MDTNGKICNAGGGSACGPGTPAGTYTTCAAFNTFSGPGQNDYTCTAGAMGAACLGTQTDNTPNHDTCDQTQVSTNNCVLHTDGYCVQFELGTCGQGLVLFNGLRCKCLIGSSTVTSGQRDYCI